MAEAINRNTVVNSMWWKVLERFSSQFMNLFIQIVLARILLPEDFGSLAIINAIIVYCAIFVQSGLSTAIVQKKELDRDGLSESLKDQLDAMQKALEMDKVTFLNLKKDEIVPFIEEEIVVRYHFQEAGVKVRLRYDDQLKEALTKPLISF